MRVTVTEDHVGDVVAMMTGIPVQRIAEKKAVSLPEWIKTLKAR